MTRKDILRAALDQYVMNGRCDDTREEGTEDLDLDLAETMLDELNAELVALAEVA